MQDQNNRTNSEREVYQDRNGNTHTKVTQNTVRNNNPDDYRDGYTHGRIAERRYREDDLIVRDNNNAARGLLIGIILTSVAGLGAGLYYILAQQNNQPAVAPTIVVPASPRATQSPTPVPQRTIIQRERTIERVPQVVPVPQTQIQTSPSPQPTINIQQAPASPAASPDININVPPSLVQPSGNSTPESSPSQTRSRNSSSTEQVPSVQSSPTASPSSVNGRNSTTNSTDTSNFGNGTSNEGTATFGNGTSGSSGAGTSTSGNGTSGTSDLSGAGSSSSGAGSSGR